MIVNWKTSADNSHAALQVIFLYLGTVCTHQVVITLVYIMVSLDPKLFDLTGYLTCMVRRVWGADYINGCMEKLKTLNN